MHLISSADDINMYFCIVNNFPAMLQRLVENLDVAGIDFIMVQAKYTTWTSLL